MAENNPEMPWTEDQSNRIRQVVRDEARGARVAGNILPVVGPLEADVSYVPLEELIEPNEGSGDEKVPGFTVDDTKTLKLSTLEVKVYLRSGQVADPELTSALVAFRRAANTLAHVEDDVVFKGQSAASQLHADAGLISGGDKTNGLAQNAIDKAFSGLGNLGEALVSAISGAIGALERRSHLGPFACVLGQAYFNAIQTPNGSLVLPQDRILPFLGGGPLARCSSLGDNAGLVIALGGAPIDLVLATDMTVEFLQTTEKAWSEFRVYEKMALRIKQSDAVELLTVEPK